jgi:hypothetical protein
MIRANYNQRMAFHRLVRLNKPRSSEPPLKLSDLRSLRAIAMRDDRAGAYSGYSP